MLTQNHRITEVLSRRITSLDGLTPEALKYVNSKLEPAQKTELVKLCGYHYAAMQAYTTWKAQHSAQTASPTRATSNSGSPSPQARNQDIHVHVHHHNQNHYWYDWWIWSCLMNSSRPYYSTTYVHNRGHQTRREDKSQQKENNAAAVILATLVVGAAVVASLYVAIEAGRCFEQLAYAEDVFGNMARLAMTAFGGALGVGGGLLFGSAVLGMPVLGAVCGCLMLAGLAIAASKKIVEATHEKYNNDSALAYDPRFCLSRKEEAELKLKGYDVYAVSEALRSVAIAYDKAHKEASTLMFWSKENKEKAVLIDLVRELKRGYSDSQLSIGEQLFVLKTTGMAMNDPLPPPPFNPNYDSRQDNQQPYKKMI